MKTLIIYAHPQIYGNCSFILDTVEKQLKENGVGYEILDLYKMNYDPILHENELYTSGKKDISELNKQIQQKILDTNKLIFIFPVWWNGMPAILKGFFDKILTSGFGFRYNKNGIPIKLLKGKKALIFTTSGGPKIYYIFKGNSIKNNIQNDILGFCGIKSKFYQFYNAMQLTDKSKKIISTKITNSIDKFY